MDQQAHHHMDDQGALGAPYPFYSQEGDPSYNIGYNQMGPYQVVQNAPQTRPLSVTDLQQQGMQQYHHLIPSHQFQGPVYPPSPPHGSLPISTSPPPASPDMYDPLSPPISGSDTSADGIYHHSNSSGANSPSSSRGNSLVHRNVRYNPTPSPTSSSGRRGRGRSHDSDEEDIMGVAYAENVAHNRKEATRRQRIEAEQRRRDELRDGYAKLKDVLPVSNQKSSKVSLLERATHHIVALEKTNQELQTRLASLEQEIQRVRALNEQISMSNETPSPGMFEARALSQPPDASLGSQRPPSNASSPSGDSGY